MTLYRLTLVRFPNCLAAAGIAGGIQATGQFNNCGKLLRFTLINMCPQYILTGSSAQVSRTGIMAEFSSIVRASGWYVISAYPIGSDVTFNTGGRHHMHRWPTPLSVITSKHSITTVQFTFQFQFIWI